MTAAQDKLNAPTLKAEVISKRMIELIKTVKNKDDISSANIERVIKIKVEFDEKKPRNYGFGGRIEGTRQWAYNLSAYPYTGKENRATDTLHFSFNNLMDNERSGRDDYAPVCTIDFDAYSKDLKDAGFSSAPYYGEHGRLLWWNFSRGSVSVQIIAYGENAERPMHQCVSMLTVSVSSLAEPVVEKVEEPPPAPSPLPTPSPRAKSGAVETSVGDRSGQVRIRTLSLLSPSKMFSGPPSYLNNLRSDK